MTSAVTIEIETVVWAVADFGQASAELVAWDLSVSVEQLMPVWVEACERGLITSTGRFDTEFPDEPTYGATAAGLLFVDLDRLALAS